MAGGEGLVADATAVCLWPCQPLHGEAGGLMLQRGDIVRLVDREPRDRVSSADSRLGVTTSPHCCPALQYWTGWCRGKFGRFPQANVQVTGRLQVTGKTTAAR